MDGTKQIADSMADYLHEMIGISSSTDKSFDVFKKYPKANTVIVEPLDSTNVALVIKRTNQRKVNSQLWWLRSHTQESRCDFAFATDCGIVFDKLCLGLMFHRLDKDPSLSRLTGYQRAMTAEMQDDSRFEMFTDPMGFFLRKLQSYDFELFRIDRLKEVMDEYFTLTTKPIENSSSGIVLGNIQLA